MPRATTDAAGQRALEHACRSAIGDRLRTVAVVERGSFETCYRRSDLAADADADARAAAVEETVVVADGGRAVWEYEDGFVTHVRVGETDVVVTSDGDRMERGAEVSAAVRGLLNGG